MSALRKNVASQHIGFALNAKADGTPVTAGGAGTVVIDNAAQAACGGTFTHKGTGQWDYAPTQAETNGTSICFAFTGTGAIQVGVQLFTIGYDPTLATQKVDVDTIKTNPVVNAGTVTFPTTATLASTTNITAATGIDVTKIAGDTTAATALKNSTNSICWGTCSGGTTTTAVVSTLVNPASLTDAGQLIGRTIIFLGNTGTANVQAQASNITASTTGATPTLTFTAMMHAPANGDVFVVL